MVCACVCMLLQKIAHTFPHILTQTHTRALTRTHLFILFRARTYIKYMWHQLNFLKEHYKSNSKCVISLFHTVYLHTRSHTRLCVCVFVYACTLPFGTFPLLYCSNVWTNDNIYEKKSERDLGSNREKERKKENQRQNNFSHMAGSTHNNKKARLWVMKSKRKKNNNSTQLNSTQIIYTCMHTPHIISQPHHITSYHSHIV